MMAVLPSHELTDQLASAHNTRDSATSTSTSTSTSTQTDELNINENVDKVASPVHGTIPTENRESVIGMGMNMDSKEPTSSILSSISTSPVHSVTEKKLESVLKKPVAKLMTSEERGEGAVGWGVYQSYFQAANKPLLLICLLLSFVLGTVPQRFTKLS